MGKGSNLLDGRVNCHNHKDRSGAEVRVDGVTVGYLGGNKDVGWYWTERPTQIFSRRTDAVDSMIKSMIETGEIDPSKARRGLREEALISNAVKKLVYERDEGLCQYCLLQGRRVPGTEYDHFIPVGAGGDASAANVQLACGVCNREKWHRHPRDVFGENWVQCGPQRDRDFGGS